VRKQDLDEPISPIFGKKRPIRKQFRVEEVVIEQPSLPEPEIQEIQVEKKRIKLRPTASILRRKPRVLLEKLEET